MDNLIHIYTAPDKTTADLIKTFLEDNNIKVLIKANPGIHGAFMGGYGSNPMFNHWLVYVQKDKEEQAKKVLEDFQPKVFVSSDGKKGNALRSFILGFLGLCLFPYPIVNIPITVAGIISGILGIKSTHKIFAIIGIIFCFLGLLSSILFIS